MELGKVKLRRNGINNLQNALHPEHGLIWTDGKGIYLAPVHLYRDQVENAGSLRLGEFEFVQSVHWSCTVDSDTCYMAAVHQQNVTVWRVSGAVPHLAFKQVRKINVQPIPQGCLWNPSCDVLCLLSRQQCSFYFRHVQNRGSFAFPALEHEKIMCGCWSPDGKRLVLCVGSALLIYTWADLEANIGDFVTAAWRIPGVSGSITAVVPASNNSLVCASDLPLDVLCKSKDADAFLLPRVGEAVGNDILKPKSHASMKDNLFNLQPNSQVQMHDTAMLSLVKLPAGLHDPTVLASATVPGLLSPDLLHFQMESQCVVVGSNAQSELQVFALLDNYLLPSGQLSLEKEQRPKGMCGLHTPEISSAYGVLVLVGTSEPSDSAFPSANNVAPFNLSLHFFATRPERAKQLYNGHSAGHSQSSSLLTKSESLREQRNKNISDSRLQVRQSSYKGERPDHRLRSPDGHSTSPDRQIKMSLARIDSVETVPQIAEEVDISTCRRLLEEAQYSASSRLVVLEAPNTSSRRLVEEVNGAARDRSDSLETEKTDFSRTSAQFDNAKLSQRYEIGQNVQDKSSVRQSRSTSKQDSPRRKELDKKEHDKETSSNAAEVKSKPAVVSNSQGGASNSLVHAATGTVSSTSSSMHKDVTDKKSTQSSATNLLDTRGIITTTPETRRPQTLGVDVGPVASSGNPHLSRCAVDGVGRLSLDDAGSVCSSFNSSDSNYEVLERQIQQQRDQIDALQKRLGELSVLVEDSACVFPVRYQTMSEPQIISIQCVVGGARVSRRFLLDNGRLQLEPLKHAFGLLTVELILDGEPLVLGANIDGYIPMKFSSGSVLQVTGIPISYSPKLPTRGLSKEGPKC